MVCRVIKESKYYMFKLIQYYARNEIVAGFHKGGCHGSNSMDIESSPMEGPRYVWKEIDTYGRWKVMEEWGPWGWIRL